jgi:hypothetical protein
MHKAGISRDTLLVVVDAGNLLPPPTGDWAIYVGPDFGVGNFVNRVLADRAATGFDSCSLVVANTVLLCEWTAEGTATGSNA